MDNKYTQPFVDATVKVLETMAFTTPTLRAIGPWNKTLAAGQVVGIIGLSNENERLQGFMSLGFTEGCICRIVSNMLGEEFSRICDEVREAVGEIANMISGQARQGLSTKGIKLQAALPKFLEQAAKELLEQQWKKVTSAKLPDATKLLATSQRIG